MADKPKVKIENWTIMGNTLVGKAYGHPRFEDGTEVRTSSIVEVPMLPEEGDVVETRNTLYELGKEYMPSKP